MKIKRLHFASVKDGIKRIKEEYGPDAVIVDMKERRSETGRDFEMMIAIDENGPRDGQGKELIRKIDEIADFVKTVGDRLALKDGGERNDGVEAFPRALQGLHNKMMSNGFGQRPARMLISDVFRETGDFAEDGEKADFFLKRALSRRIPLGQLNGSNAILILGPSGAGKTSTTKKIAKFLLDREEPVSIVAFDPARRDRYNEFMIFSETTGIPFYFAATEEDFLSVLERDRRKKIIDMPGQVLLQKQVAGRLGDAEKLVLLPSWAREAKVREYCDFLGDHVSGLVITKLDEENTLGHICNYVMDMAKPIYFFTTGTDIHDLVVADHEIFYTILIRENLWRSDERRQ